MKSTTFTLSKPKFIFVVLALIFVLIAYVSVLKTNAQARDIGVVLLSPKPGTDIVNGQLFDMQYNVYVAGTAALKTTDTIDVAFDGNGTHSTRSFYGLTKNPGDSLFKTVGPFTYKVNFTNNAQADFCVIATFRNKDNTDPTPANNTACSKVNFKIFSAAISNINASEIISVYPNPVNEVLHVNAHEVTGNTISIYDLAGKIVLETTLKEGDNTLKLEGLGNGVYLYRVLSDKAEQIQSGKFEKY